MPNLLVAMNGIEVGVLTLARSGAMSFRYFAAWFNIMRGIPRPSNALGVDG